MNVLLFIKPALRLLGWIAGKTKWKWDDKGIAFLKQILMDSPELIPSITNLVKHSKTTIEEEQEKFKGSKKKQKALRIAYTLVKTAPKKDVENVVKAVESELKKK